MRAKKQRTTSTWQRDGHEVIAFGKGVICRCPVPQDGGVFEVNDNLNMIAATPELLAACEATLVYLDGICDPDDWPPALDKLVREAVAKAKGKL